MMVPPSMPKRIVMVGNGTNPWIHCQVGIRVYAIYMYVPAYVCMYVCVYLGDSLLLDFIYSIRWIIISEF